MHVIRLFVFCFFFALDCVGECHAEMSLSKYLM